MQDGGNITSVENESFGKCVVEEGIDYLDLEYLNSTTTTTTTSTPTAQNHDEHVQDHPRRPVHHPISMLCRKMSDIPEQPEDLRYKYNIYVQLHCHG